jgi:signal peptidase I
MDSQRFKATCLRWWRDWIRPCLIIAIVLSAVRSAVADWNDVPTGSMKPSIIEGDRIFVNKLAYDLKVPFTSWRLACWAEPARGDIVVFQEPLNNQRYVKRVIGLPGDLLELRANRLFVNGQAADYAPLADAEADGRRAILEIGRASCRERV